VIHNNPIEQSIGMPYDLNYYKKKEISQNSKFKKDIVQTIRHYYFVEQRSGYSQKKSYTSLKKLPS